MAKGYITPIEVATALGLDYTDPQIQLDVPLAIEFVEEEVDQYCQTTFVQEDGVSRIYSGSGIPMLSLGYYLRNLTGVWLLNEDGTDATALTDCVPMPQPAKNGVYRWVERRQITYPYYEPTNTFPKGLNNIRIEGDWGFTAVPAAIKLAVISGVRHFFDLRDQSDVKAVESGFGRLVEQNTPSTIKYLPYVARNILEYWRNNTWASE